MKIPVMAHMIPWYPDRDRSIRVLQALVDAGVTSLEIQFPFSDPTADGPSIAAACDAALAAGFTVDGGFSFLRDTRVIRGDVVLYVMTYASLAVARGIDRFAEECAAAGAKGIIVPDLPVDSDEGLFFSAAAHGAAGLPVIVPNMEEERLEMILSSGAPEIYCAIRSGITGTRSEIDDDVLSFLGKVTGSGARVMAGFGVQEHSQAAALAPHVDQVIVGSAFVRAIPPEDDPYPAVYEAAKGIVGE